MQDAKRKLQHPPTTPNASAKPSFFKKNISSGFSFLRKSSKAKDRGASATAAAQPWRAGAPGQRRAVHEPGENADLLAGLDVRDPVQAQYETNPRAPQLRPARPGAPPSLDQPEHPNTRSSFQGQLPPAFRASGAQTAKNATKKSMFSFQPLKQRADPPLEDGQKENRKNHANLHPQSQIASTMAQTMQTQTNNQTSKNTQHISNWSNFNEQYNDLGLNIHLETYSYKQELIKIAQKNYREQDVKKLVERIQDLETTL